MELNVLFFVNSAMLGIGLAMDAFSVSLANGLNEPNMKKRRMTCIAGVFAVFQTLMPLIGWVCVHTILQYFKIFEQFIPWIALLLLCCIGGKMLKDGIQNKDGEIEKTKVSFRGLILQGIATSIDALSVGFTIAEYGFLMALICVLIIGILTFFICFAGLSLGKKFGTVFSNKAAIAGGIILIIIGLEIFITGIF
uniref:manganese efflux pump MntP n=1 Tax=Agathobacter sp. TaxID=2021311 RepID=UPI00405768BA